MYVHVYIYICVCVCVCVCFRFFAHTHTKNHEELGFTSSWSAGLQFFHPGNSGLLGLLGFPDDVLCLRIKCSLSV